MKTILVIESDISELESTMDTCRQGQIEFTVLSAQNLAQAQTILSKDRVDLIICSTVFPDSQDSAVIAELTGQYAFIPLLGVAPQQQGTGENDLALGASAILERPLDKEKLLQYIDDLTERSSTGTVKGIPISSFLQMLENDGDSCTLCITCDQNFGTIFLSEGTLVGAETGALSGEEAVYEMISWDGALIEIRFFNGQKDDKITKPLISLIMEGLRLKDEKDEQQRQQQTLIRPHHNLKQISTAGHRLALEIGLRLKMEFDSIESNLDSSLVGLVPDKCVITTTPSHFVITQSEMAIGSMAIVKFTYMGKLCMFESKLVKSLDSPLQLLFFEYPKVIYYHEMRKTKRTSIYIPCSLDLQGQGSYAGTVLDISSSGTLCQLKARRNESLPSVSIRQSIQLRCILPGLTEEQTISGIIRNIKTNSHEIRLGVEFANLGPHVRETINHYLVEPL
jgi:c-di-GMP-binding flagellar brake protein YcgR/CheY-like chemotaxis protein